MPIAILQLQAAFSPRAFEASALSNA